MRDFFEKSWHCCDGIEQYRKEIYSFDEKWIENKPILCTLDDIKIYDDRYRYNVVVENVTFPLLIIKKNQIQ